MPSAKGDGNGEAGAFANLTLGINGTPMQPHKFLYECQTNSRAFVGSAFLAFDAMETLEQAWQFRCRNTGTRITHDKLGKTAIVRSLNADGEAAFEGKLERVGHKVEDDLLPHVAIDIDGFAKILAVNGVGQSGAFGG